MKERRFYWRIEAFPGEVFHQRGDSKNWGGPTAASGDLTDLPLAFLTALVEEAQAELKDRRRIRFVAGERD